MDPMEIIKFVKPELLILIPVLYFIGMALKKSATNNKWIPFILGGIGILLSCVWTLASTPIATFQEVMMAIFVSVTQGVLVAGCSVYVNQLIKQAKE